MTWPSSLLNGRIDLHAPGRIEDEDADRQLATATEILRRLERQPGVVLADEVGMGKTFVALTVALAAAWADEKRRSVVVMVPAGLQEKWERDYIFLRDRIKNASENDLRHAAARNGLAFFRILERPAFDRPRLIFLSHGAFSGNLRDPWVKFAVLRYAMRGKHLGNRRDNLPRFASRIFQMKSSYDDPTLFTRLLKTDLADWRGIIEQYGKALEGTAVPKAIRLVLERGQLDLSALGRKIYELPIKESSAIESRILDIRRGLNKAFQDIWREALRQAEFRSPLIILDEAHHLKNPATELASLFVTDEAKDDADTISGALADGFERMLFLTATPFQLGHTELLNVLDRFRGINWKSMKGSDVGQFGERLGALKDALDLAQRASADLDSSWQRLRPGDIDGSGANGEDLELWWARVLADASTHTERAQEIHRAYMRTRDALRAAQTLLRPWVIRHLRARTLPHMELPRRLRIAGAGLASNDGTADGLPIADSALLPFMLAARAQAMVAHLARTEFGAVAYRATFAEGLASAYETFLETKSRKILADEAAKGEVVADPRLNGYLRRLREALPSEDAYREHPKIAAVVSKVADLWQTGEKVVVFCHWRVSARVLVRHISGALFQRLDAMVRERLAGTGRQPARVVRSWDAGFERGQPLDRGLREVVTAALARTELGGDEEHRVVDVVRRFVRTPMFLARHVDLASADRPSALRAAFEQDDNSGFSLRRKLDEFIRFMTRCTPSERAEYLEALEAIQPGRFRWDEMEDSVRRGVPEPLHAVRLATGLVDESTRRHLLLGFNTPFLPEVLVASSVMAEGIDLHLNCRYMIHHDLAWNPSTLEQRTGRIDRIGCKAEQVGRSIHVYLPYVGGTQDEKMYRVVMDRERWFHVIMGEKFRTDEFSTDRLAERVPLPESVCRELALDLSVVARRSRH